MPSTSRARNPDYALPGELQAARSALESGAYVRQLRQRLDAARVRSLNQSLRQHGAPSVKGPNALAALSRGNLDRLLPPAERARLERLRNPEIDSVVGAIQPFYVHNTHITEHVGKDLLSSLRLTKVGLSGGMHSMHPFNQEFLKSSDNVYFYLLFHRTNDPEPAEQSEYGHVEQKLHPSYARKHAWVSPFLMSPRDLTQFAKVHLGYSPKQLHALDYEMSSTDVSNLPMAEAVRNQIWRLDFTPEDLETLVRLSLKKALLEMHFQEDPELPETLASLRTGNLESISTLIKELVLTPLGIPNLELKVPVSLPFSTMTSAFEQPSVR